MKTRVSLKYFVNHCLWKYFFASHMYEKPANLICFDNLITPMPFTQFIPKVRAIKLQNSAEL